MRLLKHYLSMHLKTSLEYRISFFFSFLSNILLLFVEAFAVYSMFQKFQLLEEYNIYELLLVFSIMWLGYSLAELFGRGFDEFSKLIIHGDFDILLIRPRSIFLQVLGSDIYYERLGRVLLSFLLYGYAAHHAITEFTFLKFLLLIFSVFGCFLIIFSLFIIKAFLCFYTIQGLEVMNVFTDGTKQACEYPLGIYHKAVRLFFTFFLPVAFVNYYPVDYLLGRVSNPIFVIFPFISIFFFCVSLLFFKIGLKKYASSGS